MYTEHLHIPVGTGASTLHVERSGRGGPAVVLLHGFATCVFLWREVAPLLAASGCTTIAIDLPGHGESDHLAGALHSLSAQAGCIEQVLTALGQNDVTVVAQDTASLAAVLLAHRYPARVRSLLLLEPPDPDNLPGPLIRNMLGRLNRNALGAGSLFGARSLLDQLLRERIGKDQDPNLLIARYTAPFVGTDGIAVLLQLADQIALSNEERRQLADLRVRVTLWLGQGDDDTRSRASTRIRERLLGQRIPAVAPGRKLLDLWSALLPSSLVEAILTPSRPGALVAEVDPALLATTILESIDDDTKSDPPALTT